MAIKKTKTFLILDRALLFSPSPMILNLNYLCFIAIVDDKRAAARQPGGKRATARQPDYSVTTNQKKNQILLQSNASQSIFREKALSSLSFQK